MKDVLEIDGRYGEGGGQILRTSLSLSTMFRRTVQIHHIRGGRKKPGLRPQHLLAVQALASISSAIVKGAELDSQILYFEPRDIRVGSYRFNVGTAGSTGLVLQAMIPALLFGEKSSNVTIIGGTHVPWSPCFHYLEKVFVPALESMGGRVTLNIHRWGWYPAGGGDITASIDPVSDLRACELAVRGQLKDVYVLSAISNLPMSIARRQGDQVVKRLRGYGYGNTHVDLVEAPSPGPGTLVFVGTRFENTSAGFTSLGRKGRPAEKVADDACSEFFQFVATSAAADYHLADQMALYMALAKGRSLVVTDKITGHLKTNIWVIERFLPVRFQVDETKGSILVEGMGADTGLFSSPTLGTAKLTGCP